MGFVATSHTSLLSARVLATMTTVKQLLCRAADRVFNPPIRDEPHG